MRIIGLCYIALGVMLLLNVSRRWQVGVPMNETDIFVSLISAAAVMFIVCGAMFSTRVGKGMLMDA